MVPPDTLAGLRLRPGLSLLFDATTLPGNVGRVSGRSRCATQGRDTGGFLTYGTYLDLPAGCYEIVVSYSAAGQGHWWDVAQDTGGAIVARGDLVDTKGAAAEARATVALPRAALDVEVRTGFAGTGELAVQQISITRVADAAPASGPQAADPDAIPAEEDTFPPQELRRTRERAWILDYCRPGGIGAEFGVFRGHFAEVIARVLRPRVLHLVDLWTQQGERFDWRGFDYYEPYTNMGRLTTRQALADTRRRMRPFSGAVDWRIHEQSCVDFCEQHERSGQPGLDFVYLDTSHTFEDTLRELRSCSRILAPDGVIAGDDWVADRGHPHHGVFLAVHAFLRQSPFELVAAGPQGQYCLRRASAT